MEESMASFESLLVVSNRAGACTFCRNSCISPLSLKPHWVSVQTFLFGHWNILNFGFLQLQHLTVLYSPAPECTLMNVGTSGKQLSMNVLSCQDAARHRTYYCSRLFFGQLVGPIACMLWPPGNLCLHWIVYYTAIVARHFKFEIEELQHHWPWASTVAITVMTISGFGVERIAERHINKLSLFCC